MNEEYILRASHYVDDEMNAQERHEFEQLMQQDDELHAYVQQYQQAHTALKQHIAPDAHLDNLKNTLGQLNSTYFTEEEDKGGAKVVPFRTYTRWVSGIAAILIMGLLVFNPWRKSLYEQYNTATVMSVTERGEGSQTDLEKAAAYYNQKDFQKAENLLAVITKKDTTNNLSRFYYALTLIEDKKPALARPILEKIYQGQSAFKYDAAYYLGLSYIKDKDKQNCKAWLLRVPAGTANYTKARELLQKL